MARIAIFEDNLFARMNIYDALGDQHEIVGEATSIEHAHTLLRRMALHEVTADYTLLDANLEHAALDPTFRFIPPGKELPPQKNWLGRPKKPAVNPHEIVIAPEGGRLGRHGKQISRIIRACNISTFVIGVSTENASAWGGQVDADITKWGIYDNLAPLIAAREASK